MHARKEVAVDDIVTVAVHDGLLVGLAGAGFGSGNKGRADVGKVGPAGLGGQDGVARSNRARQGQRAIEPLANLLDQRKGVLDPGMATSARSHGDKAVGPFLNGFVRKLVVDDVMQHHTAVAVGGGVDVLARAQGRDDDRHLVLHTQRHVVLQTVVALVHDLVDGKRCRRCVGVGRVVGRQRLGDFLQPLLQHFGWARVERGHGAHHPGLALGNDELGGADDEQGRSDHRKRKPV